MTMRNFRTGLAAAVGGAVLVAGVMVGASIARADSTATTPTVENHTSDAGTGEYARWRGVGDDIEQLAGELGLNVHELRQKLRDGATIPELADAAGVDLDTMVANIKDRLHTAVEENVTSGRLSREQADAIEEKIDSFDLGGLSFPHLRRLNHGPGPGIPFLGRHGDWLGDLNLDIDLAQLRDKLDSGLSLKEALTELGVDVDSVVARMKQVALDKIDQLVTDGVITQDRADELEQMVDNFELGDRLPRGPGAHLNPGTFGPHGHRPNGSQGDGPHFFNRDRRPDSSTGSTGNV